MSNVYEMGNFWHQCYVHHGCTDTHYGTGYEYVVGVRTEWKLQQILCKVTVGISNRYTVNCVCVLVLKIGRSKEIHLIITSNNGAPVRKTPIVVSNHLKRKKNCKETINLWREA